MYCCCGPNDEEIMLTEVPSSHVLDQESQVLIPGPLACGSFSVSLNLVESQQLGLKVDNSDERGSMILEITEGIVANFNLLHPERAIRVYDRVLKVNGELTAISELHRIRVSSIGVKDSSSLELLLSRPQELTVTLTKPGSLGLSMKYSAVSTGIIIDAVLPDGLVSDWNRCHAEHIAPGDRIIAVDGMTLAGTSMLEEMKSRIGRNMELSILHYNDAHAS